MKEQMDKIQAKYVVYDVADHKGTLKSPMWWNAQNQLQIIRYAKEVELKSVLILDDDCLFVDDFNQKLEELWPKVPDNWDIVSFGDILSKYAPVCPGIVKAGLSWGGHASLIRDTMYDRLLESITGHTWSDEEINIKLKNQINYYVFSPYLVTQTAGYSDLKNQHVSNDNFG
jgi:GR25 family glycosyltransferase involved in LPS biosynthesis